ncbi:MAG: hypothetical protein H7Y10_15480 [Flavobacterium sp.]|nr:hypothetical protein [Flavobacterium sp.]
MKNIYLLLSFFFSLMSLGQVNTDYALVDAKMDVISVKATVSTDAIAKYINANFKTENDKIRAVFYWTASNISYDVANMYTVTISETSENKIKKALETRKGVCSNYAEIFNDIANKVGIKSVIIQGYTKQYGKVADFAHAWCGAKIENKWYVFDPTWGSGYVNNSRFLQKINNYYFKAEPSKIISSHIPFDYLWQFSSYPITNAEFYEGEIQINKNKKYFDFEREILKYEDSSEMDNLIASAERIESNGVKNTMIFDRLSYKKSKIEYIKQSKKNEDFNRIVDLYNEGIRELNEYIHFRNKQFKPNVSDEELVRMIQDPKAKLLESQELLGNLDKSNSVNVNSMRKGIIKTIQQVEDQEIFVINYLNQPKMVRKTMFSKRTGVEIL